MKGFSLFEVLVAMTLISVGLLSILAMTVKTMRLHQEAFYTVIAETQLENLFEQLRDRRILSMSSSTFIPASISSFGSKLSDWNQMNKKLLPDGKGKLQQENNGTSFNEVTITVEWDSRIKRGSINRLCSRAVL
jgi:prepilin-type N-terminal cleavage/methylation domain-containing protein